MGRPNENKPGRTKRLLLGHRIFRLHLQGKQQAEIAELCGITQPNVSRWIQRMKTEALAPDVKEIQRLRGEEVQKIDMREAEAWAAWERSLKRDAEGKPTRAGDPRFLSEAADAARDRAKLLGLHAPRLLKAPTGEAQSRLVGILGVAVDELPD